tara:strand:- start:122974 stop:123390 length:417 start_codon:yes stop_codon:yes gene_type:complete
MRKRSKVLDKIRKIRNRYIDIFIDNSFDLSDRIQHLMELNDMDQKDLAQKLNKKESEISKWMSGSHNFTLKTLAKIEDVLGDKLYCVLNDEINLEESKRTEVIFINQNFAYEPNISSIGSHTLKPYSSRVKKAVFSEC